MSLKLTFSLSILRTINRVSQEFLSLFEKVYVSKAGEIEVMTSKVCLNTNIKSERVSKVPKYGKPEFMDESLADCPTVNGKSETMIFHPFRMYEFERVGKVTDHIQSGDRNQETY